MNKRLRFFAALKLIIIFTFLFAAAVFFYSCKNEDNPVDGGDENGNDNAALAVVAPKAADTLYAGGSYIIRWQSNFTTPVKIEFSYNEGVSWWLITDSTANTSSYLWDPVPDNISEKCRIRVSNLDNSVSNISEGNFKIMKGQGKLLNLTRPNGGELLFAGQAYTITWMSNDISQIKIEFSANNGASWNMLAPNFPADSGSFNWNPIPDLLSNDCLIRITDLSEDTVKDVSNAVFSVGRPQSITVLSPNGKEDWPAKSSKVISWYSSEVSAVKIEYSNNNGVDWYTIESSTPSDGYYLWNPLPDIASTNARIRISDASDGYPSDASDSVFTVSPEEALSVIEPNGGEQWISGSSQYIRWNSNKSNSPYRGGQNIIQAIKKAPAVIDNVSSVKLEYTTNAGSSWNLIADSITNNGSYIWNSIPSVNSSLCKVRISDMQDGVPYDLSDSTFTIYNTVQQELSVTAPNGGELWQAGTTQPITWQSSGITSVKIEYTINNGINWIPIVNSTPSDGYFSWNQVPNSASTNCKIRISDASDGFPSDLSNGLFTIAPEPDIIVISPNGQENLQAGSSTNIKWTSTNISQVKIEFTTNNGANWSVISQSTPSDGLYEWQNIPDISSALCRIRISDADDGQPYDISDNNFVISNQVVQSLSLIAPNGTEEWEAGTSHDIIWTATAINTVKVEYTTNNGITWVVIADSLPSSGSAEWSIPSDINSTQCKVRVSDRTDGTPVDESDAPFSVKRVQTIKVISPNGGESIIAGDSVNIKWEATGIEKVKIEFTTTNSLLNQNWYVFADNVPSGGLNGSLKASFAVPTNECRIRISDASDGSPSDASDGVFVVAPQPVRALKVISPNGGENWLLNGTNPGYPKHTYEIKWSSTKIDRVNLEYTINGGAKWNSIAQGIPSNGIYNWVTPDNIPYKSDICRVKITSSSDSALYDLSDSTFSMYSKMLRVTFPNGGDRIIKDTAFTWVSADVANVRMEITTDNGVSWSTLADNLPSSGAYWYQVPPMVLSSLARIRITEVFSGVITDVTDMSDGTFDINHLSPTVSIISPKKTAGSILKGSSYDIAWSASKGIHDVRLEYSADGGKSWNLIAEGVKNNPSVINKYSWRNIPENIQKIKIRVTDSSGKYSAVK